MAARFRIGANVKILDVILVEAEAIIQGTPWNKDWLDWNELPAQVVRNNPAAYAGVKPPADPEQAAKEKLDAWRRANPDKFPADAWTFLGGKGPIPTPSKTMPARDLRSQPPDDSGTWVDSGTYWTHTIPPFVFAVKPDDRNSKTWGPKGSDTGYMPVEDKIGALKKDNPNITDKEIEATLRELPGTGTVGGKMYSNREIVDGIRNEKSIFAFNNKEKQAKADAKLQRKKEAEALKNEKAALAQANQQFAKNKTCPIGFEVNDEETGCERDPDYEPPENGPVVPVKPENGPVVPVKPENGPVVPVKPENSTVSMIWPAGDKTKISSAYGARNGNHHGVDLLVPYGTDVSAPEDGTVTKKEVQVGLAGLFIEFTSTDNRRVHTFMHLSATVPLGKVVKQGNRIAQSGGIKKAFTDTQGKLVAEKDDQRAGRTNGVNGGAHLHWELTVDGEHVDPVSQIK